MHDDPLAEPVGQSLAERLTAGHLHRAVRDEPHQMPGAAGDGVPERRDLLQRQGAGHARAAEHDVQQFGVAGQQFEEALPVPGESGVVPAAPDPHTAGQRLRHGARADPLRAVGHRVLPLRLGKPPGVRRRGEPRAEAQPAGAVVGRYEESATGHRDDGAVRGEHDPVEPVGEPLRGAPDVVAGAAAGQYPETDAPAVHDPCDALPHRVLGTGREIQDHQGVLRVGRKPPDEGQRPAVDEPARVDQQCVAHAPGLDRRPGRT
ncbi:hypothetical protein [Streptomyces sp. 8L]|uniref:hypothetical protein n=1 Tax=Streptomyces sp. 8L TaxID=2877242 RepID=UPI001CD7E250|nr:hypothetical protein [Streptomyces sp. 8L]MCA1217012.1 hypothetical protein [Streptomyces sp. 8L]